MASFFSSIDKTTLFAILTRKIKHPELTWLTRTLLFHDPTKDYRFRSRDRYALGPESPAYPIPPHKSLFGKGNERGLPIGNLTSQFWGNVYLNELDHFIKRELRCRYYLRYVDGMVLLANDAESLSQWREAIERFLGEQLKLSLRPEMSAPFPVKRGIDFVGWKTLSNYRLPRRRTLANLATKLESFERSAVRTVFGAVAQRIDLRRLDESGRGNRFHSLLASYAGHLKHGAVMGAWEELWAKHRCLGALLERRAWSLAERWSVCRVNRARSFRSQYWRSVRHAGDDSLVFFQVGRFIEFYGPQRMAGVQVMGLRSAMLPRANYGFTAGFPTRFLGWYAARALRQGLNVVEVREATAPLRRGCLPRLPCALLIPFGH